MVSVEVKHHVYLLHSPFLLVLRFIQPGVKGMNETLKINTKASQGPVFRIFTREVDSFLMSGSRDTNRKRLERCAQLMAIQPRFRSRDLR